MLTSAILSIIGSILVAVNIFWSVLFLQNLGQAETCLKALVLGVLLATALTKFDKKSTAAIFFNCSGCTQPADFLCRAGFMGIVTVLLLSLKFDDDDDEQSDVQMFM